MLKMSAPNSNLFGAHLAQICAPNKPEPLKGNHFAQKRPKWARYFAHKWCSSLFRAGSGERSERVKLRATWANTHGAGQVCIGGNPPTKTEVMR